MNSYAETNAGLKKVFWSNIGALICAVVAVIPIIGVIGTIGALVCTVIAMLGLKQAGTEIEGCQKAFTLYIVELVIAILAVILGFTSVPAAVTSILAIVQAALDLIIIYLICTSVSEVLNVRGNVDVAKLGKNTWILSAVGYGVGIVISLLALIPVLALVVAPLALIIGIVKIVASIMYLVFLYKCTQVLV